MTTWIILVIYIAGYIYMWRTVVWTIGEFDKYGDRNDQIDIAFAVFFGSVINFFWPSILAFKLIKNAYGGNTEWLMPRNARKVKELKEREKRIAQLERELKIK